MLEIAKKRRILNITYTEAIQTLANLQPHKWEQGSRFHKGRKLTAQQMRTMYAKLSE
jgi:hypothetical protein